MVSPTPMWIGTSHYSQDLPDGYVEASDGEGARYVHAAEQMELVIVPHFVTPDIDFDEAIRASVDQRVALWHSHAQIHTTESGEPAAVGNLPTTLEPESFADQFRRFGAHVEAIYRSLQIPVTSVVAAR